MAEKKTGRLGTGLSALFGEEENILTGGQPPVTLPLSKLEPKSDQPRRHFDEEELAELAESIRTYGLIQPITVRPLDKGYYQIIAGEHRWRAARMAGLYEVPVRVLEADDRLTAELALVENLQRSDLDPMEEAAGYRKLMDTYGLTQEQVAERVQKSRPTVANALRLLSLGEEVTKLVSEGVLSAGHARALVPLKSPEVQKTVADEILRKGLSVRQTEALVASLLKEKKVKPVDPNAVDYVKQAEMRLSNALGRGVKLSGAGAKGRITLEFYSADDREALMDALLKMKKTWDAREEDGE